MRASISSAVAAAGLVALEFRSCDGLSVGTDHACVLLDDASVKVRDWRDDLAPKGLTLSTKLLAILSHSMIH